MLVRYVAPRFFSRRYRYLWIFSTAGIWGAYKSDVRGVIFFGVAVFWVSHES